MLPLTSIWTLHPSDRSGGCFFLPALADNSVIEDLWLLCLFVFMPQSVKQLSRC